MDEISQVFGAKLGHIIKDISRELSRIIPKNEKGLTMSQIREINEYMENLDKKFPSSPGLISFIKNHKFYQDKNYLSLINIESRRKMLLEIFELKNLFDIHYFSSLFGPNFLYFDPTDDFIDNSVKSIFEGLIESIFIGKRKKGNTNDKIHLYTCCSYVKKSLNEYLKFITKDKALLARADLLQEHFQILKMENMNLLLESNL